MSGFLRSAGGVFLRSPGGARGLIPTQTICTVEIASVPYQGFGNSFSNAITGIASGGEYNKATNPQGGGGGPTIIYNTGDITFTYQRVVSRVDWYDGSWDQTQNDFYTYWINGYGLTTQVSVVTQSNPPPPVPGGLAIVSPGAFSYTPLVLTQPAILNFNSGHSMIYTMTLSNEYTYSAAAAACLLLLASLPFSPLPTAPKLAYFDLIYPAAMPGTLPVILTAYPANYIVAAANGLLVGSNGKINGGSLTFFPNNYTFSVSSPAIICAKSKFMFGLKDFSGNQQSPKLYNRPLSTPAFAPQPVLDLGISLTRGPRVFLPGLTTELMHTGSDIPPNGFTPPYQPPYKVPGFGEIGFNSDAQ